MSSKETDGALKAVIYTDGGYKQHLNLGSWAIHGYTFTDETPKQGTGHKSAYLTNRGYLTQTIINDKKIPEEEVKRLSNITIQEYVSSFGSLLPPVTNNVAELQAMINALQFTYDKGVSHALLRLDSKYAMDNYQAQMDKWKANGWIKSDGQPVANQGLWEKAMALRDMLKETGQKVEMQWVKGHSNEPGNETVDKFCTRAMLAAANGTPVEYKQISPAKGFWTRKTERSRMLNQPHWYFHALNRDGIQTADGRFVYYSGFSGKGGAQKDGDDKKEVDPIELFGKRVSDARFSIAYLKNPDPVMEHLRETCIEMAQGRYLGLMVGELRNILASNHYLDIEEFGTKLLKRDHSRLRLSNPLSADNDVLLTREIRPARLAYMAIDTINALERVLQQHIEQPNQGAMRSTDITDILYETDDSKKKQVVKLKSHISNTSRSLDVKAGYAVRADDHKDFTLKLTLGLDLPDRNTLAALASEGVKAWVVTWPESSEAIRYATIIESEGDIGLWCAAYSNLQLIKAAKT